jgi:hypothetical protein
MTRKSGLSLAAIFVGVCVAIGAWLWPKPKAAKVSDEAIPSSPPSEPSPAPRDDEPTTPKTTSSPPAAAPSRSTSAPTTVPKSAGPSVQELSYSAFTLYDELIESMETLSSDCVAMAGAMSVVIETRTPELTTALTSLDGGAKALMASPEGAEVKARIERFSALLRAQMPRCAAQLQPVLSRWSDLQAATSHAQNP